MNKVELTPANLAELRQKAEAAADSPWIADRLKVVRLRPSDSDDPTDEVYQVASCEWIRNAEHIAAADPATVLAMVQEIERFRHFVRETLDELHECYNEESCKICKEIDRVIESEATQ